MLSIPTMKGTIRRRVLVNYRADADVVQRLLPPVFRPKLHGGRAIVGICLIRLENIRPQMAPLLLGVNSENAAHRIAVLWNENGIEREGVYIPRRDTNSRVNAATGGRLFPGQHQFSSFEAQLENERFDFRMKSRDGAVNVNFRGHVSETWPRDSVFASLKESSAFFEGGSLGYSVRHDSPQLDGLRLQTHNWRVEILQKDEVASSYFSDISKFPDGSIAFDHALLMRDIEHQWHAAAPLDSRRAPCCI